MSGKFHALIVGVLLLGISGCIKVHVKVVREDEQPVAAKLGDPPGSYESLANSDDIRIPFDIYRGDIRMKVKINGDECNFLLDNGSLWDQLLFFGSTKVDSLGLNITGETVLGDSAVPNPIYADVAHGIDIEFDNIIFRDQPGIITRYIPDLPNLWEGIDGQISAAFFKNFVVTINFDELVITLTRPESFFYRGGGQMLSMGIGPENTRTVNATVVVEGRKSVDVDLLVDLGGIHAVYLPVRDGDRIALPENAVAGSLAFGVEGYTGRISSITLGDYTFENVTTAFTPVEEDASIYGNTMIGMPLLNRFNIIFDYFGNRLILEPNENFDRPF